MQLAVLVVAIAFSAATAQFTVETASDTVESSESSLSAGGATVVLALFALLVAVGWTSIAASVKRLHDLDASGWLIVFYFIPVVNLPMLFFLLCRPGTEGANIHGPQPPSGLAY